MYQRQDLDNEASYQYEGEDEQEYENGGDEMEQNLQSDLDD